MVKTLTQVGPLQRGQASYGRLVSCVVKLSNGQVLYNQHFSTAAYALSWELAVEDELGAQRSVLKMGQS
jgi:hypothetical protein